MSYLSVRAQETNFQASELPAWIRRGGCAKRRRGGRLNSKTNSLLNLADHPVRSPENWFLVEAISSC